MQLPWFIRRIFSTKYLIKAKQVAGNIPTSKDAYLSTINIAYPAVIEMVSMALMGMLDTIMVGRIGPHAVAAVGLVAQPRMIFFSLFFAVNISVTALVARYKGAKDQATARKVLRMAIWVGTIFGALFTALAVFFAEPLMRFAGAQYDTIEHATAFFRISGFGIIFVALSGAICAAQRAAGNTKLTMKVNIVANVVKVIANFLLIEGRFGFPRLEVGGAAVSLVLANVVAFVLAAASLFQKDSFLYISIKDSWKPDIPVLRSLGKITSGGLVEQVGLRVGFFLYALIVANLGTADFASHQIGMQLMNLSFTFADGIAIAATALVGQNLGLKRPDLSVMYGKIGMRLAIVVSIGLSIVVVLVRNHFPMLFTTDLSIIATSTNLMLIMAAILPIMMAQIVLAGTLRGSGDTRFVAMTMIISVGILRPTAGFLLTYTFGLGLMGAWITIIIDQGARLIMLGIRFSRGKWLKTNI